MSKATDLVETFFSSLISELKKQGESNISDIENQKQFFLIVINDLESEIKIGKKIQYGWIRYQVDTNYLFDSSSFFTQFTGLKARTKYSQDGTTKYLDIKPLSVKKLQAIGRGLISTELRSPYYSKTKK